MKLRYVILVTALLGFGSGAAHADTLKATIEKALATNPEVLGAVANRQATERELDGAKGPLYPTVDLHLGSGNERSKTAAMQDVTLNRQEVGMTLRQTLYDGGATSGEVARQTARLQALDSRVFDVSDSVAQRVADIYLEVLKATELYDLAKNNLDAHRNYREKIKDRVKAGVAQRADLQLAEGREALASSALTTREAGLDDAKIRFRRLVGEMPRGLVRPSSISRTIPALLELAGEIAFANNASLKVAKDEVVAARLAESTSRARFMPVISLDAGATRNRNIDGTRGQNSDNTLMLMMNYNLFKGGTDRAKMAELGARLTSAIESENNVYRTIEEEVGRAWVALNAAKSSLDFLKDHAQHTAEVKDAYQSQFDVGKRTMIDLMNAENELFQAKSSYISGLYAVEQSEYRLLSVMGGILKINNIKVTSDPAKEAEKQSASEAKQAAEAATVRMNENPAPIEKQSAPEARQAAEAGAAGGRVEQNERAEAEPASARLKTRNARDYFAAYTADFKPDGMSRDVWEKQRLDRVNKSKFIEVTLSNIRVSVQDDNHATASFTQNYRSDSYRDRVEKTLQMVKQADHWLIAEEHAGRAVKAKAHANEPAASAQSVNAAQLAVQDAVKHWADAWSTRETDINPTGAYSVKAEQQAQAAAEVETARLKAEQEAEEKVRQIADVKVAKLKAKLEAKANAARLKTEQQAKARAEKQAAESRKKAVSISS